MTREEAIKILSGQEMYYDQNKQFAAQCKATRLAVISLEAWDKVRIEIILESKKNYTNSIFNKGLYRAIEIIDKYSEVSE